MEVPSATLPYPDIIKKALKLHDVILHVAKPETTNFMNIISEP